jgi:hypothetical protein
VTSEAKPTVLEPPSTPRDCPICRRPGWGRQRHVQRLVNRGQLPVVREVVGPLLDDRDGRLREFRCGPDAGGLWHPTNLDPRQLQAVVAPEGIVLPLSPADRPSRDPAGPWHEYLAKVSDLLTAAVLAPSAGLSDQDHDTVRVLALPGSAVLAQRYGVTQAWVRQVRAGFVKARLMHCIGGVYVTVATGADDRSAS